MSNVTDLQDLIRSSNRVHIHGAKTKLTFHAHTEDAVQLSTRSLIGVVSYDPQEFVITVGSGTPVAELVELLAGHGQYLPFDPLLAEQGSTIGGTVASNASGPGRFRYGGIRDFLLGVQYLDGRGNLLRGGGQVVKNAAGFDYPKLFVGSCGSLGLITELTFKVFPRPESTATIVGTFDRLHDARSVLGRIACSPWDVDSLELIPRMADESPGESIAYEVVVRLAGLASALPSRMDRLKSELQCGRTMLGQEERDYWEAARNFRWITGKESLTKLPIVPEMIDRMESHRELSKVNRRYSVGGNVAWLASAWTKPIQEKFGQGQSWFGGHLDRDKLLGPFGQSIRKCMDPDSKFV